MCGSAAVSNALGRLFVHMGGTDGGERRERTMIDSQTMNTKYGHASHYFPFASFLRVHDKLVCREQTHASDI